ncbi:MAG: hypothetical protein ACJ71F_02505, partial [Nitrososphaeraceae archaeon]
MNYTRPTLAITIEPIRVAFNDAKERGIKLRYLTEISKDNISFCKELIPLVDELRHLDGIKGDFMVSESEYLAPVILFEKGKIASEAIYSNQKEIVDQHQYMFDSLWNKAVSAEQRIKEIDGSKRGNNTRWVGTINKDNVQIVKAYLDLGMKIKHINNMPPMNFAVSSKELYITIDEMKGGQIAKNLLISNEPPYIRHYISIFEDVWNKSVPAEQTIREIEEGVILGKTEVIQSPEDVKQLFINMVK